MPYDDTLSPGQVLARGLKTRFGLDVKQVAALIEAEEREVLGALTPSRWRDVRSTAARSAAQLLGAAQRRTLESGRPARRRARGPVGQPPPRPPVGSSVPRGNKDAAPPDGLAEGRQRALNWSPRSASRGRAAASVIVTRMDQDA